MIIKSTNEPMPNPFLSTFTSAHPIIKASLIPVSLMFTNITFNCVKWKNAISLHTVLYEILYHLLLTEQIISALEKFWYFKILTQISICVINPHISCVNCFIKEKQILTKCQYKDLIYTPTNCLDKVIPRTAKLNISS